MKSRIINNPEHYFNRYIACEVKSDRRKAQEHTAVECSLDEKLNAGDHPFELIANRYGECFDNVGDFLDHIENPKLHTALLSLTPYQLALVQMLFVKQMTHEEIAANTEFTRRYISMQVQEVFAAIRGKLL